MSQNFQGYQDASLQQRLQQQGGGDLIAGALQHQQQQQNTMTPATPQQHQSSAFPAVPGLSATMLLPNQPFAMLQTGLGASSNNGLNAAHSNNQQPSTFDMNTELKRWQQLQQQFGNQGPGQNSLLFSDASNQMNQVSVPNQAALFQSMMLDQQKLQLQNNNNFMGVGGFNPFFAQPGLFQDARLLLAQSQPSGMMPNGAAASDVPLPSPHSLFHRDGSRRMRGGVIEPFPEKLHRLLTEVEAAGRADVISFVANGRAFAIHKPDKFFKEIVPLYFRQSRLSSFKRQLNLYGFELINTGPSRGGYFHELFVKDRPDLCRRMRRVAVKVASNKNERESEGDAGQKGEQQQQHDSSSGAAHNNDGEVGKMLHQQFAAGVSSSMLHLQQHGDIDNNADGPV